MFSLIPLALLVIPALEIAVFIIVGQYIGVMATLAMIFITAIIGSILLRVQGFGLLRDIQKILDQGGVPGRELVHGVMILLAGVLLLTPGFVTDTIGFLLFIPPIRDLAWQFVRTRIVVHAGHSHKEWQGGEARDSRTIDLDETEFSEKANPDSPWKDGNGKSRGQ
jgi:UPF0716 protein FxsA